MSRIDLLKNKGVLVLNVPDVPPREKTVIVLGAARSGTTMVAAVLQSLGVYMGENLGPVLEDVELSEAVETRDVDRLARIVSVRNAEYPVWGWKRPSAFEYADVWRGRFRNPYIVAIFRDPFAIANRNRISMLSDVYQNMKRSVEQFETLIPLLERQEAPVLLCSYEKALVYPEAFVEAIANFISENDTDSRAKAVLRIDTAPRTYLQTSRITQAKGCLDVVNEQGGSGWAFYPKVPNHAARVQIFVNGALVDTIEARLIRPSVKEKGLHPTGLCGFKFSWPVGTEPRTGDWVDVRAEGDDRSLTGAPKQVGVA